MSDNFLRYVPMDASFQPSTSAANVAEVLLLSFLPKAKDIASTFSEDVRFVDAGANWEGVFCPSCGADAEPWWGDAMSTAAEADFKDLMTQAPCCKSQVSLNAMRYGWPVGFARYVLEAMNPNAAGIKVQQLQQLSDALGCPVREISVHV